jgi:hydroxyacylglutathione hydrolase
MTDETQMLHIQTLTVGELQTNCYLVSDSPSNETCIIDPGDDASYIAEKISSTHIQPVAILGTHGHFDHVLSAFELQHIFHIPFYIHPSDEFLLSLMKKTADCYLKTPVVEPPPTPSKTLQKNTSISVGSSVFKILQTPGHTPGGVCFYCPKEYVCFTGDTVFEGGAVGDWHHKYSNKQALLASVQMILSLPTETVLYPGHGHQTTVA